MLVATMAAGKVKTRGKSMERCFVHVMK